MEEAPEPISPRISFSHDLATATTSPPTPNRRSDTSLLSRLSEPEFDFPNAAAADDVAPADRLFAGGVLLPMPPLPPAPKPSPCKQQLPSRSSCHTKPPPACQQQKRPAGSSASAYSRSSSVNSTTTRGLPRSSGSGRFGCPSFPLMRSQSAGSAAVARDGGFGSVFASDGGAGRRPQHKKFGAAAAGSNGGGSRVYYYGGSKKGGSHGVRVSPVINVPFVGTVLALLCAL
ncbi:hypothetical protein PR202_ga23591 [Eleusine coracana subsp. coracana]|uniref:Uncharacterized protein n=1 Tax=Eleusine coracana subsp. coracana TaxID=191504 RepID=A0AAV5D6M2_ELECO|nr:hypothetical protein PR202_ga23591 [Eleusine coracana subsp. coracana]